MFTVFTVFTKKQQTAIDMMISLHTLNHDDIGDHVSKYIMDKLTDMGVFDYDTMDHFWDFSSKFHSYLLTMGVIDQKMSERISYEHTTWEIIEMKKQASEATQEAITEVSETYQDERLSCSVCSQFYETQEEELRGMCNACFNGREWEYESGNLPIETEVIVMVDNRVSMDLMGTLTIAEVIEAFESNMPVKVKTASLEYDTVTLEFEPIPHDDEFDDPIEPYASNTPDDPDYEAERCYLCDASLDTALELKIGVCNNCMYASPY